MDKMAKPKKYFRGYLLAICVVIVVFAVALVLVFNKSKADTISLVNLTTVNVNGHLMQSVNDDFSNNRSMLSRQLEVNGKVYYLPELDQQEGSLVKNDKFEKLKTSKNNTSVSITGKTDGSLLYISSYTFGIQPKSTIEDISLRTTGNQKIGVFIVQMEGENNSVVSTEKINDEIFNSEKSVKNYYYENSYQKLNITGDIYDGIVLPKENIAACDFYNNWINEINDQIVQKGIDLEQYDYRSYFFTSQASSCNSDGYDNLNVSSASVGGNISKIFVEDDNRFVFAHEFGHNLGLSHANGLVCYDKKGKLTVISSNCESWEYYDQSDVMGSANEPEGLIMSHTNTKYKLELGWLDEDSDALLVNKSGVYKINPLEKNSGIRNLIIHRGSDSLVNDAYYYLDYRQPIGFDNYFTIPHNYFNGLSVRLAGSYIYNGDYANTKMIDLSPQDNKYLFRDTLLKSNIYTDPMFKIKFELLDINNDEATVKIDIPANSPPQLSITSPSKNINVTNKTKKITIVYNLQDPDNDFKYPQPNLYIEYPDKNTVDLGCAEDYIGKEGKNLKCSIDPRFYSLMPGSYKIFGTIDDHYNPEVKSYALGNIIVK